MFIPSTREALNRVSIVKYLHLTYLVSCCMSGSLARLPILFDATTSYLHRVIVLVHCAPFRIWEQCISPPMVIRMSQEGFRVKRPQI